MPSETYISKLLSTSSTSLENLPNNLPTGVESKNSCGARNIPSSMPMCIATDARKLAIRGTKSTGIAAKAEEILKKEIVHGKYTRKFRKECFG